MPSSHLACDGSTEPVSCPYPPFRAASPCGGRRQLWDLHTDSRAPRPLRFCLAGSYTNFKNRKSAACRQVVGGIAQSPHGHRAEAAHSKNGTGGATVTAPSPRSLCTEAALALYDYRLEAAETARQLHWDCTISVQSPCSLCTDLPRLAPEGLYKNSQDARRQCEHILRSP